MADLYSIEDLRLSLADMTAKPLFGAGAADRDPEGPELHHPEGRGVGIVGGSGSGKSTLGRALVRLLEPSGGAIRFDGTDITHLSEAALRPLRRRFQMIFQDPMSSLEPAPPRRHHHRRTVCGCTVSTTSPTGWRARWIMSACRGLSPAAIRMSCRAASASGSASPAPSRWSPTSFWPTRSCRAWTCRRQAQVLNLLERLVRDLGLTLAFISHDLSVIRRLCQRTIVLHHGAIVEDRPTADLFADPQAAYTRELLEAIPLPDPAQPWT